MWHFGAFPRKTKLPFAPNGPQKPQFLSLSQNPILFPQRFLPGDGWGQRRRRHLWLAAGGRSVWGLLGFLGAFWDILGHLGHFGGIRGFVSSHLGFILEAVLGPFGTIWRWFEAASGSLKVFWVLWGHPGGSFGVFWGHFGII